MGSKSSDASRSPSPESRVATTAPSSPPELALEEDFNPEIATKEMKAIYAADMKARDVNNREQEKRKLALQRRKNEYLSQTRRKEIAESLEAVLLKCEAFSDILTKKTKLLGRVGSGFDGKALGEHDLVLSEQPECMQGGTLRGYQLEGLTWMFEVWYQGMSGILADEMGLGKTLQTIAVIAKIREEVGFLGPFLIAAPLSTISNWMEEFEKWAPSIPLVLYHGTPTERKKIFNTKLMANVDSSSRKPRDGFPIVLTTPEIIIRDEKSLEKIVWRAIIVVSASLVPPTSGLLMLY